MTNLGFKPSNMVMVAKLNCRVDMKCLFDCLSVLPLDKSITINMFTVNNKVKVPFFGVSNSLIGVRYYTMSKGLKRSTNPRMNAVFLDLQYANKNIHVKISEHSIQMTGILSDEMGYEVVNCVLDHLQMNHNHLLYMKTVKNEVKINTANWILQRIHSHSNDADPMPILQLNPIDIPVHIDSQLAKYFLIHSYGLDTYEQFYTLLQRLLVYTQVYEGDLSIRKLNVVTSMYNYDLGTKIALIPLALHLNDDPRFEVSLANWVGKSFQVTIGVTRENKGLDISPISPDTIKDLEVEKIPLDITEIEEETVDDLHNHTITIYPKGTINQKSPSFVNEAYRAYIMIYSAIQDHLNAVNDNKQGMVCT